MAKEYTYRNSKTGQVLFSTIAANHVSMDDVDKMMLASTGHDPRLDPFIDRQIRVVNGPSRLYGGNKFKRY